MLTEIKSDARVSAAESLAITDESFARAACELADALARGDEAKLSTLLNRRALGVVQELKAAGTWTQSTKGLEAVRIVYASAPASLTEIEKQQAMEMSLKANVAASNRLFEQYIARGIERADARAMADDQLKKMNQTVLAQMVESGSSLMDVPEMVCLTAVQDGSGSILLGWSASRAGGKWTFSNSSTTPIVRAKANDWDDIGMLGFSLGTGKLASAEGGGSSSPGGGSGGGGPQKPNSPGGGGGSPSGPSTTPPEGPTKRTPAGPVKIPGVG
ncbi:MAG: hypothetical protein IBJ18_13625 [Phycisphaerales bacterium]|nr:hypothetical protein [Phycisphaerales bacterium]